MACGVLLLIIYRSLFMSFSFARTSIKTFIALGAIATLSGCQANSPQTALPLESTDDDVDSLSIDSSFVNDRASDRVSSIFQNDPATVTFEDAAIGLAIVNLPVGSLNSSAVSAAANRLLGNSEAVSPDRLTSELLRPDCVDYAGTNNSANLDDIAVILAAANAEESLSNASDLARAANRLLSPFDTLEGNDIAFIPGRSQPCQTPEDERFDIQLRFFDSSLSPSQQAIVRDAANRWMTAIVSDLPAQFLDVSADECLAGTPSFSQTVDDLAIDVYAVNIDRVNGTLAQAGPCIVRPGSDLPAYGVLQFDTADLNQLERDGELLDIALHEMAHVLGFGTIWTDRNLLQRDSGGVGLSDPRFTGSNAIQAYAELGASGTVPVENIGGSGSVDSHWRESRFDNELMTSRVTTGFNPLSRLTLAQFVDLGYQVDLSVADAYSLPPSFSFGRGASSLQAPEVVRTERLIFPKRYAGDRD